MSIKGSPALQILTAYRLVKQLTLPWEEWEAYDLGLIDKKGKKIRDSETPEEEKAMPMMVVLAANIKRILQKLPGGGSKFASMAAALFLLKEEADVNEETILYVLEQIGVEIKSPDLNEELSGSVYFDKSLIRYVEKTNEQFLDVYDVYSGKDIISGKEIRFIHTGEMK